MKEPAIIRVTPWHASDVLKTILVVDDVNLFDELRTEVYNRNPNPLPIFLNIESSGEFACPPEIIIFVLLPNQQFMMQKIPYLEKLAVKLQESRIFYLPN